MKTSIGRRLMAGLLLATLLSACSETGSGVGMILSDDSGRPTAPPTSAQPTSEPPLVAVPTETHSGKGKGEFTTSWPPGEPGFLTFDCPKCSSNIVVETDGDQHLLINAIGAYHGTKWFNVSYGGPTTKVTVTADAAWTATIADFGSLPVAQVGKPMSGKGDAVVGVPEGTKNIELTGKGSSNFQVWVTVEDSISLLVNEIGNFHTTAPVKGPAFVQIGEEDGSWTITPS